MSRFVEMPAAATRMTASELPARIAESETGRSGGLSRMIRSHRWARACMIVPARRPARSSEGFGGIGPAGRIRRCGLPGTSWRASSISASPSNNEVNPTSFDRPKNSWSRGLRRSQPTITTSWPAAAMVYARLQLIVVLPSVAFPLVTSKVLIGSSIDMNWIEVRIDRNASAAGPLGCSAVISRGTRRSVHSVMAGMSPKAGMPGVTLSRSERERILSSIAS